MQELKFEAIEHKRFWISQYSKLRIPLPPLAIQKEIVSVIERYRKIIDGAQQVVECWQPIIEINPEWQSFPLEVLCDAILSGGTPSTKIPEYWTGEIPWITSADIVDIKTAIPRRYINQKAISESATNLIPKDSLIVVTRVGLGKLFHNNFDVCISQDSQGLVLKKDKILPLFALYILADKVKQFKNDSQGSTIQGVTKQQLSDILIPLPTMQKQHEIVRQLESELSFIETSKQMIELYKHKINVTIAKLWEN